MEDELNALPSRGDVDARARKRDRAEDLEIMVSLVWCWEHGLRMDLAFWLVGSFGCPISNGVPINNTVSQF